MTGDANSRLAQTESRRAIAVSGSSAQGREARRSASADTDQVRARDQSQDGESARPRRAADAARPRRRGDRIAGLLLRRVKTRLAQSRLSEMSVYLSVCGGKADRGRRIVPIISDANDPKRTWRGLKSRSAAVGSVVSSSIA